MVFLESVARPLLVAHTVAAAVLVAATTHHLVWLRGYVRRDFGRHKGERRFAMISAIAFVVTFVLGNLMYPTYKVRVRAEFFDNPTAVGEELKLRDAQARAVGFVKPAPPPMVSLSPIARLFDIKEHWVALGCAASVLLWILSRRAHPKDHANTLVLYLGLAMIACGTAWWGAIVGVVVASFRAVGALG